jgi:FlaA1/EpsC-like NDP-sugar epimerase
MTTDTKRKILIFGASLGGTRVFSVLGKSESVVAFVDNDPAKQGKTLHGHDILPTPVALKLDFDAIIIASQAHAQIGAQLVGLGVPKDRIEVAEGAILRGDYELRSYKHLVWIAIVAAVAVAGLVFWLMQ